MGLWFPGDKSLSWQGGMGSKQPGMAAGAGHLDRAHVLCHKPKAERAMEMAQHLETSRSFPSEEFPTIRSHPLDHSKQHHQLGTTCSSM